MDLVEQFPFLFDQIPLHLDHVLEPGQLLQVVLGLTNVITSDQMLKLWKYTLVGSTIVGAIVTPSTDPITQLCLSLAILILYFIGIGILKIYKK